MRRPHPLRCLRGFFWDHFATVPYLPVVAWVGFAAFASLPGGGIHPTGRAGTLPEWLVMTWTLAFALGSTAAFLGGSTGRTRIESSGLAVLLFGLLFYGAVVLFTDPADPAGTAVSVVAFAAMCMIRMRILSLSRKAIEAATRLSRK